MAQEMARKDQEMARKDREIAVKDGRVQQLQCEVEVKGNSYISNTIITHLHTQELHEDLQLRVTQLKEDLQSKEVEISGLREELRKCQEGAGRKVSSLVYISHHVLQCVVLVHYCATSLKEGIFLFF